MKYIDAERLIAYLEREADKEFKKTEENANSPVLCHFHNGCRMQALDTIDFIKQLQQEQPEVDLEKFAEKIKTFQERYKYPEIISIKGAMAFMARMFYQYPNVARQWYERLPKVTID